LETGERLLINEHATFHAASTMKTPVMIEVFKQVAAGTLRLSDSIPVRNSFSSIVDSSTFSLSIDDDSEGLLYTRIGSKVPLSDLVYQMIIASSNLATNIIIELVGASNVTRSMRDLGAPDIQILRGVEDTKAFEAGLNNTTTAYDLMVIFEKIASGEAVDTASSKAMIDILRDQTFNSIIPAMLPRDVVVAHKTGNITGVHHDSGVVELPDGRKYVLVLLSKNLKDVQGATKAMSEVSFLLYNHISGV
jgi:beta-lactamase class A